VSCDPIQERLDELLLARTATRPDGWDPGLADHVAGCAGCAEHVRFLGALRDSLAAQVPPGPSPDVLAGAQARARRALRARSAPRRGLARELAAALAVSLLALPVMVGQAWLVAEGAGWLLQLFLPATVVTWLGVVYFGSVALAVGTLYALIPLGVALARQARAEAP
jgi:hypothetical protein